MEGDPGKQLQGVHAGNLLDQGIIANPLQAEGQNSTHHTQREAFHDKGQADKTVGSAYHLHNGDLIPAVIHSQLNGVGDDQKADHQQHSNDCGRNDVQHALDGAEALCQLIGCGSLRHTGQLLQLLIGLLHQQIVFQHHHIPVAQVGCLHAAESTVTVMVCNEILQRFLPGNKGGLQNVVQQIDLCADGPGLSIGQFTVHIDQDLTGPVQIPYHFVQIVGKNREAAYDNQAGHRNADSGKGHEAMGKNTLYALF